MACWRRGLAAGCGSNLVAIGSQNVEQQPAAGLRAEAGFGLAERQPPRGGCWRQQSKWRNDRKWRVESRRWNDCNWRREPERRNRWEGYRMRIRVDTLLRSVPQSPDGGLRDPCLATGGVVQTGGTPSTGGSTGVGGSKGTGGVTGTGGGSGGTTTKCALRGESCVTSSCCAPLICSNATGSSIRLESYLPPADSGTGTGGTGGSTGKTCGGIAGVDFATNEFCDLQAGSCNVSDATGTCVLNVGVGCITIDQPVCGCNGHTYPSDCYRQVAGVSKKSDGACPTGDAGATTCGQVTTRRTVTIATIATRYSWISAFAIVPLSAVVKSSFAAPMVAAPTANPRLRLAARSLSPPAGGPM